MERMTIRYEGQGPTGPGRETDGLAGFRRWKAKQAAKRATAPTNEDRFYEAYMDAATGRAAERRAGVPTTGTPGGREVPDDLDEAEVYQAYRDVLSGEAGRQAGATARREKIERGGLSSSHEHLRDRLRGFGRVGEGGS